MTIRPDDIESIDFLNHVHRIETEEIYKLTRERAGELECMIKGLNHHCFAVNLINLDDIRFEYFNYESNLDSYYIKLKYKENEFYSLLLTFVFYLSKKFSNLDGIQLYNTFINCYRRILESNNIITITNTQYQRFKEGFILIPNDYEIIEYVDEVKFYRNLLVFNDEQKENTSYVYLMFSEKRKEFKIGLSKNPNKRKLQGNTFDRSIVLLKIWKGSYDLETNLKNNFYEKSLGGEWFKLNLWDLINLNKLVSNYERSK